MNEAAFQPKKNIGGIPANRVIVPIIIVLTIFHVLIIGLILSINTQSGRLSETMQKSGSYIEDATSLLAGSSVLSETSSNFVLMPTTQSGEVNINPLMAYAQELTVDRRGDQIIEKFQSYHVGQEAMDDLTLAADSANNMLEAQLHALALVTAVHPLPDIQPLNSLPLPALTPEEEAWPDAKKMGTATVLILGSEYAVNKQAVSTNVNSCVAILKAEMGKEAAEAGRMVGMLRTGLWAATLAIIVILVISFVTIYRLLIFPLNGSVKLITGDKPLDESKGLREMRLLAFAYNGLLRRRDALEGILRSAAVTDTLTNLPNRYGYEQYLLDLQQGERPMAVILFDVNFLKRTNDSQGHAAGDQLLRNAADSIGLCFGNEGRTNCFRFGGDEFAAVVEGVSRDELDRRVMAFQEDQRRRKISISWGCAYAEDISQTTFKALMDQADKEMYQRKEKMHVQDPTYAHSHNLA